MSSQIRIPDQAQSIITLLESAGFFAYAVGGCVRDSLLGREPLDWDVATSARPEQTMRALAGLRVIETGLRHGTVTALAGGLAVEVTSFRLDGGYSDHRRPDAVIFTDDLCADLSRRDFTVNAMAWHPARGLCDPFGGAEDLQARRLRCVGDPARRLEEDALRILRAMRFASVLGFTIEARTAEAVLQYRERLRHVAAERIREELLKLSCGENVRRVLEDYRAVILTVLPPLVSLEPAVVEAIAPDPALRLAALCHAAGEDVAREVTARLRCSRAFTERVALAVRLCSLRLNEIPPGQKRTVRLRRLLGEYGEAALLDGLALTRAAAGTGREACDALQAEVRAIAGQGLCVTRKQLAVNGNDLAALGLKGPALGHTLDRLLEEVLEGRVENTKEALLAATPPLKGL